MVHAIEVDSGNRDNVLDAKLRAVTAGGKFDQPLSPDENLEWFLASLNVATVGVQDALTGHYVWTFVPGTSLQSLTVEWFDGYRNWQERGVRVEQIDLSGKMDGDAMVNATLFGQELTTNAQTAAIADRVPSFTQGWEAQLYIDAFGGTPGTTVVPATLLDWKVSIKSNLGRKHFGDNTTATGAVIIGKLGVTAELTLEGNASGFAEFANWDAATKRLVQLKLGNNGAVIGTSVVKPTMRINMPGVWTKFDLTPEDQGTKAYKLSYQYVRDVTNAYGIQVILDNARATAF